MKLAQGLLVILAFSFAVSLFAEDAPPRPSLKAAMADFKKIDAELNTVWENLKETLPAADFSALKEDQRSWIKERDYLALSPGYSGVPASDEDAARKSPEYFVAAKALTEERIAWLKVYGKPLKGDSLNGVWSDCEGGQMQIFQDGAKFYFSFSVVRGHSAHTGEISGIATWKSPKAFYSDKGLVPDKTDETTLTFTFEKNTIEVVGVNTIYYHGANAYFDGSYLRIRSLTAEEKNGLLAPAK